LLQSVDLLGVGGMLAGVRSIHTQKVKKRLSNAEAIAALLRVMAWPLFWLTWAGGYMLAGIGYYANCYCTSDFSEVAARLLSATGYWMVGFFLNSLAKPWQRDYDRSQSSDDKKATRCDTRTREGFLFFGVAICVGFAAFSAVFVELRQFINW